MLQHRVHNKKLLPSGKNRHSAPPPLFIVDRGGFTLGGGNGNHDKNACFYELKMTHG